MMTNYEDFMQHYNRERAAVANANALNRPLVFEAVAAAGVTYMTVVFDGEGDSGQIEDILAQACDQSVELPSTLIVTHTLAADRETLTTREQSLPAAVEELCYAFLEAKQAGWENNDGAYGEFQFDVAERTIVLEFNARFTDVNTDVYEL